MERQAEGKKPPFLKSGGSSLPCHRFEFEQKPKESGKAFEAFSIYLSMGPERSLAKVAQRLGRTRRLMERWSSRWEWDERVRVYQQHVGDVEREKIESLAMEKAVEWNRVHEAIRMAEWDRHRRVIAVADRLLARWEKNEGKMGTLEGVARLYELAGKLARMAAGLATEVKEVNTTVTATVDVDWEIAIRKAYDREKPAEVIEVDGGKAKAEGQ